MRSTGPNERVALFQADPAFLVRQVIGELATPRHDRRAWLPDTVTPPGRIERLASYGKGALTSCPATQSAKARIRTLFGLNHRRHIGGRECAGADLRSGKPAAAKANFLAQISGWGSGGRGRKFGGGVAALKVSQWPKTGKCAQIRRGATYAVRPLPWSDTPGCLFALLGFAPRHPPAGALRSGTPTRKGARPPPGPTPVRFRKLSAGRRLADPPRFLRPLLRRAPPCRGKPASRPGAPSFRLAVRRARRSRHRPP